MKKYASIEEAIASIREEYAEEIAEGAKRAKEFIDREYAAAMKKREEVFAKDPSARDRAISEQEIMERILNRTPRFWYVKNISINDVNYDAEIDNVTGKIKLGEWL